MLEHSIREGKSLTSVLALFECYDRSSRHLLISAIESTKNRSRRLVSFDKGFLLLLGYQEAHKDTIQDGHHMNGS